ncbi:MAG: hypothetical protein ACKO8Q_06820, partial [Bacteroidota bacterium]
QNKTKILGIWQAKLNGKYMTGRDFGTTSAPYASQYIYYIFIKENCYLAIAPGKSSLTKTNIEKLINKEAAGMGTYDFYESLADIPEYMRSTYEESGPFKPNTCFIESYLSGETIRFYFEPSVKKLYGLNKEINFELVYVGPSW